jgi:hypothetical protein
MADLLYTHHRSRSSSSSTPGLTVPGAGKVGYEGRKKQVKQLGGEGKISRCVGKPARRCAVTPPRGRSKDGPGRTTEARVPEPARHDDSWGSTDEKGELKEKTSHITHQTHTVPRGPGQCCGPGSSFAVRGSFFFFFSAAAAAGGGRWLHRPRSSPEILGSRYWVRATPLAASAPSSAGNPPGTEKTRKGPRIDWLSAREAHGSVLVQIIVRFVGRRRGRRSGGA